MLLLLDYVQFQEYMCENIMTSDFNKYCDDDGCIEIEYKYGDYKNGKSMIKFRIPDTDKVYTVRYTGSSCFAMWWSGLTDGIENDDE